MKQIKTVLKIYINGNHYTKSITNLWLKEIITNECSAIYIRYVKIRIIHTPLNKFTHAHIM